jgi:hypothetical protein
MRRIAPFASKPGRYDPGRHSVGRARQEVSGMRNRRHERFRPRPVRSLLPEVETFREVAREACTSVEPRCGVLPQMRHDGLRARGQGVVQRLLREGVGTAARGKPSCE